MKKKIDDSESIVVKLRDTPIEYEEKDPEPVKPANQGGGSNGIPEGISDTTGWSEEQIQKETILLKFDADRFPYVVSKPIHHSQTVFNEEEYTIQIEVRPNNELISRIFSFFPQVEVLQPKWLRDDFQKKIAENLKKYSSMQKDCTDSADLCTRNIEK